MDPYQGFDEFVTSHTTALSRVAFLLTGDHHLAEDLLQVALSQVASRWPEVRDGNPAAYVRRCLVNEFISWRRRRRYHERPVEALADGADPVDLASSVVRKLVVGRALAQLTPRQRAVLVLRFYKDLSEAETAATVPLDGHPGLWWSGNDRWLLTAVVTDAPNPPETATLIDLARPTPALREIDLRRWPGFAPAAVRTDGTIVLRPVGSDRLGDVVLVDPDTGDGRRVSIDLAATATPDELAVTAYVQVMRRPSGLPVSLLPVPDGSMLLELWRSFGGSPTFGTVLSTDVIVLDLDAGVVRERWHLPEPRPIPDSPRGDWETWRVEAVLPEGLLLTHRSTQRRWAWELYDPATGALSLVTDLRGLASAKED